MDHLHLIQTAPKHVCPLRLLLGINRLHEIRFGWFYGKMKKICLRRRKDEPIFYRCTDVLQVAEPPMASIKTPNTSNLSQKTLTYLRVPSETSPNINGVSWQSPLHWPQRQRRTAIQDLATSHGLRKVQDGPLLQQR